MNFSEFLATHSQQELLRIQNFMDKEGVTEYEEISVVDKYL